MRILVTTDFYLPHITGVTTVVVNEQNRMPAFGHEVRILTVSPVKTSYYADGVYHIRGFRVLGLPDSYFTFSYHDALLQEIVAWKPQIIHSNNEFITMTFAKNLARQLGVPLIHTCHTDFTRYDTQQRIRHTLWDSFMATIVRRRVRFCDVLISPSLVHKEMLERYHIKRPVIVLPSGIDLKRFHSDLSLEEQNTLRNSLGLSPTDFVMISVCRLASEKRVNQTIDSFYLLSLLESSARLLLVGGGPKEESLRKQVSELGLEKQVLFTGPISSDQVHRYYQIADVFVSSSVRESQGLGFVEAMASSLAVILKEDSSLNLSVEELGCGYVYGDARSFVLTLTRLMENRGMVRVMGLKAREVSHRFSLENWAASLSQLMNETLLEVGDQLDHRWHHHQG